MKRPSGFDDSAAGRREGQEGTPPSAGRQWRGVRDALAAARERQAPEAKLPEAKPSGATRRAVKSAPTSQARPAPEALHASAPEPEAEPSGIAKWARVTASRGSEVPDASRSVSVRRVAGALKRRSPRPEDPIVAAQRRLREASKQRKEQQRREARRFVEHQRRRRRGWWVAALVVAALAAFVGIGAFTPVMAVRQVEVSGVTTLSRDEVTQALRGIVGTPLALVSDEAVRQELERFPRVERYAFEVIPPHTLRVRVVERVPVLAVKLSDGVEVFDAAGVSLGTLPQAPQGVPEALGAASNRGSAGFTAAAHALRDMAPEVRSQTVSVTAASGQDVTLKLASGIEVMWGDTENGARESAVLLALVTALADRPVQHIDVSSTEAPIFR